MKPGIPIILILIPFLWIGCAGLNPTGNEYNEYNESENHLHSIAQTRSFGDRHYHAVMRYDDREGILAIEFSGTDEDPVKIIKEGNIKARLNLPDGETKEFSFSNPVIKKYPSGSRQAKKQLRQKPESEIIYAKNDFFRNLSNFSLIVWVPVEETTYVIKYNYPEVGNIPEYFIRGGF